MRISIVNVAQPVNTVARASRQARISFFGFFFVIFTVKIPFAPHFANEKGN